MKTQIPMFRFTVGTGQSIGPKELLALWIQACRTTNASVGRAPNPRSSEKPTYSLYAPQGLDGLADVERRLRTLLDERNLRVSLTCVDDRAT